eukprot:TRINITY_DN403_c0_g1_i1.p1 TRINITY_DN403_c0_g1~~TRINITY_DN403_c0_g1_i1.p1  ORF type:complete len:399 (-),score=62.17 TRINITY_DN403_c0_g1_i1:50-1246(-)
MEISIFVLVFICYYLFHRLTRFPKLKLISKEDRNEERLSFRNQETHRKMRMEGDPLADQVIEWLETTNGVKDETKPALENIRIGAQNGHEICKKFISEIEKTPKYMNKEQIKVAQECFQRIPLAHLTALLISLVFSYLAEAGAQVLVCTGRLKDDTRQRLSETLYMILKLNFSPLEPNSEGHQAIVEVRLLHAQVRRFIKKAVRWDFDKLGVPINQEDLLGTFCLFSSVMVDGAISMGATITDEEKDAINHLWQCAGYYVGINEEYMPRNYQKELQMREYIAVTQISKNEKGSKLANYLINNVKRPGLKREIVRFVSPSVAEMADIGKGAWYDKVIVEILFFIVWSNSELQRWIPFMKTIFIKYSWPNTKLCCLVSGTKIMDSFNYHFRGHSKKNKKI